jgi:hypothetical protein
MAPHDHVLSRLDANTLELDVQEGRMVETPIETMFRAPTLGLQVGDVVRVEGMVVRVLAEREGHPTKIAASFDRPIDDSSLWFVTFSKGRLRHVDPPRLGERRLLSWEPGPLEN